MGFWDGSGISWTICKQSAPRCRLITTPTPHRSIFTGQMLFLMPIQWCQIIEGTRFTQKHTHPFNGPFSRTTRGDGTKKVKPIWILLKQETVSGSDISWAVCKSAPRSRQITTLAPHQSVFIGRMPSLPPNQQRQSTEGSVTVRVKLFK